MTHHPLRAVKAVAVVMLYGFLYVRFLTTPVPNSLSLRDWSIIGVLVAVIVGSICRLLIRNAATVGALAAVALIAGAIWTEVHFPFPLSHDTVESSTWRSYVASGLYGTWPYGVSGVVAVIAGWHVADRLVRHRNEQGSS